MEPFSTHRPWDQRTTEAYHAQPQCDGKHFPLTERCTPYQIDQWRQWCVKYPDLWPGHVKLFIAERKRKGQ